MSEVEMAEAANLQNAQRFVTIFESAKSTGDVEQQVSLMDDIGNYNFEELEDFYSGIISKSDECDPRVVIRAIYGLSGLNYTSVNVHKSWDHLRHSVDSLTGLIERSVQIFLARASSGENALQPPPEPINPDFIIAAMDSLSRMFYGERVIIRLETLIERQAYEDLIEKAVQALGRHAVVGPNKFRIQALGALFEIGGVSATGAIANAIEGNEPEVVSNAKRLLGKMGDIGMQLLRSIEASGTNRLPAQTPPTSNGSQGTRIRAR